MMKALLIVGSPREKGCTSLIVDSVIDGMKESSIAIKKYVLGSLTINYCMGCKSCQTSKQCVQCDDMDVLIHELLESDLILIAAPSYWGDVPGQLKVFIDRCTALCNENVGGTPVPPGKKGYSIAIRAGSRVQENQHLIDAIQHYYGHLGIEPVGQLTFERIHEVENILDNPDVLQRAHEFGRGIAASLR